VIQQSAREHQISRSDSPVMREAWWERRDETCWCKKCIRGWSEARKLKVSQGSGDRMPGGKGTKLSGTVAGKLGGEGVGVTGQSGRGDGRRLMLGRKLCSMPAMPGAKLGEQGGAMVGYDDDEDTER
jgi:hypothetical protein